MHKYSATHDISFMYDSCVTRSEIAVVFKYRLIFLGRRGDIVGLFAFHINHVISKSRRSSRKEVVHAISLIIPRAIWNVEKTLQKAKKSLL